MRTKSVPESRRVAPQASWQKDLVHIFLRRSAGLKWVSLTKIAPERVKELVLQCTRFIDILLVMMRRNQSKTKLIILSTS